jgi:hypothetical protein
MPTIGRSERIIGKVSATLEMTCLELESSSITELLEIQPTWTSPVEMFGSPQFPLARKTGCAWHYDSASQVTSPNVSNHIQHLLSRFIPIKSRIDEMRPIPRLRVSVYWECKPVALEGLAGPDFTIEDLRGIVVLGAQLHVRVIETNELQG